MSGCGCAAAGASIAYCDCAFAIGGSVEGIFPNEEYFSSSSFLPRVSSKNPARITTMKARPPMMAVGTDPIAALMESTNPSEGFSVTVRVMLVIEFSLSSSVTVSVNVHCPGSRFVSVYSGPVKSTSPV